MLYKQDDAGHREAVMGIKMKTLMHGASFEVKPGDSWCIPGNVTHGAQVMVDSVAIEVFSPLRPDYLPSA